MAGGVTALEVHPGLNRPFSLCLGSSCRSLLRWEGRTVHLPISCSRNLARHWEGQCEIPSLVGRSPKHLLNLVRKCTW